jgi:hypothetical protein
MWGMGITPDMVETWRNLKMNQYLWEIEPEEPEDDRTDTDFTEPDDDIPDDILEECAFERVP